MSSRASSVHVKEEVVGAQSANGNGNGKAKRRLRTSTSSKSNGHYAADAIMIESSDDSEESEEESDEYEYDDDGDDDGNDVGGGEEGKEEEEFVEFFPPNAKQNTVQEEQTRVKTESGATSSAESEEENSQRPLLKTGKKKRPLLPVSAAASKKYTPKLKTGLPRQEVSDQKPQQSQPKKKVKVKSEPPAPQIIPPARSAAREKAKSSSNASVPRQSTPSAPQSSERTKPTPGASAPRRSPPPAPSSKKAKPKPETSVPRRLHSPTPSRDRETSRIPSLRRPVQTNGDRNDPNGLGYTTSRAEANKPPSQSSSLPSSRVSPGASESPRRTDNDSNISTHADIHGLVFPSHPRERYRVTITSGEKDNETTLQVENIASSEQGMCTFSDITAFKMLPERRDHPTDMVFEGLVDCLHALPTSDADGCVTTPDVDPGPGSVDLICSGHSGNNVRLQLDFLAGLRWAQQYDLPLKVVPEQHRLASALHQLDETKCELELTRRNMGALTVRNQQLERVSEASEKGDEARRATEIIRQCDTSSCSDPTRPCSLISPPNATPGTKQPTVSTFIVRSSWLKSSFTHSPVTIWEIRWEEIVSISSKAFELVSNRKNLVVKIRERGTYQLNLNVTHLASRRLVISVISVARASPRMLDPTVVQYFEETGKCTSRIDQLLECEEQTLSLCSSNRVLASNRFRRASK